MILNKSIKCLFLCVYILSCFGLYLVLHYKILSATLLGGEIMVVSKDKVRKMVTFYPKDFAYLEKLAKEKSSQTKGLVTVSNIIADFVENDRKIRSVFVSEKEEK